MKKLKTVLKDIYDSDNSFYKLYDIKYKKKSYKNLFYAVHENNNLFFEGNIDYNLYKEVLKEKYSDFSKCAKVITYNECT